MLKMEFSNVVCPRNNDILHLDFEPGWLKFMNISASIKLAVSNQPGIFEKEKSGQFRLGDPARAPEHIFSCGKFDQPKQKLN